MIAVDTNILVHAHRVDSAWHEQAATSLRELAAGRAAWAIPWPCIHEFIAVVTHARIFKTPTPLLRACDQVEAWLESPTVILLTETGDYWPVLRDLALGGKIAGPKIHDARIAAICELNGVTTLLSADRDFSRFPSLVTRNPLVT